MQRVQVSPSLVVDLVAKARGVDNGQGDTSTLLVQLQFDGDGLDLNTILDVGIASFISILMFQNTFTAEGVDECCPACFECVSLRREYRYVYAPTKTLRDGMLSYQFRKRHRP
jgi:hypothetical protein